MALVKLAVRNLRRNRRRTVITLAALVLGVAALVSMRGLLNGLRRMMTENQVEGTLGHVQVHRAGYLKNVLGSPLTLDMADTPELRNLIAQTPGVVALSPRIEFGAQLSTPDKRPPPEDGTDLPEADRGRTTFLLMSAFDPAQEAKVCPRKSTWVSYGRGHLPRQADAAELVINEDFSKGLVLAVHPDGAPPPPVEQQLALLAPDRDSSLNGENVVLAGTFGTVTPADRKTGWLPLAVAQRLLRMDGRVTEYAVAIDPKETPEAVRDRLAARLGADYEVHTWEERVPFLRDAMATWNVVFNLVSTVFLLVVLLGIVNAMLMSVLERVREIGTMLAVGMRRRQIARLFLAEGLVLGLLGGVCGMAVGVALVLWLGQVGLPIPAPGAKVASLVRPSIDLLFLLRALAQASGGAAVAALWPAYRASRLRPVEALSSV